MIKVVNMIPAILSAETNQDSEPNLSVNPANPLQIAATAFTPDPAGTAKAPIYVSTDGGDTWRLNAIVPHGNTVSGTGDITIRFATAGNSLYAGDLRGDFVDPKSQFNTSMDVLRAANFAAATLMNQLESHQGPSGGSGPDQPWIEAATVPSGAGAGKDRVYVGNNDLSASGGKTATIDLTLDAKASPAAFTRVRLEKRSTGTAGQDGFQIRIAIHSSGVIYAVFYGWRSSTAAGVVTADVVIVRDDSWGSGANPFTALKDAVDHLSGLRVVKNVTFPTAPSAQLGHNRLGGDLAIAVDPNDSNTVYLVYGDQAGSTATLHVRRSSDGGATWSADLLTLKNSILPGVAVNDSSEVGLLYQQVTGSGANETWQTHYRQTSDGTTWSDAILSKTPTNQPAPRGQPYLGDYNCLKAVGNDFYGVFCAANTPDLANFPQGVTYQRKASFTTKILLNNSGSGNIKISIDPFFFKVTPDGGTGTPPPGTGTPPPGTGTPPATGTPPPVTGTPPPVTATPPPVTGTPPPVTGTPPPVTGTPPPVTGTPPPVTATPPPVTGTPPPVTGTPPPVTGTPPPVTGTPPPVTGTPPPVTATPPPVTGTPPPVTGTPPPVTGTPPPVTGTPPPVTGTPPPVTGTPNPVHFDAAVFRGAHSAASKGRGRKMVFAPRSGPR